MSQVLFFIEFCLPLNNPYVVQGPLRAPDVFYHRAVLNFINYFLTSKRLCTPASKRLRENNEDHNIYF